MSTADVRITPGTRLTEAARVLIGPGPKPFAGMTWGQIVRLYADKGDARAKGIIRAYSDAHPRLHGGCDPEAVQRLEAALAAFTTRVVMGARPCRD